MTTKKSMKRSLLCSALALLLCVSMLIGTTFAWFTDSVVSGNNVIQSGNLDVAVEFWNGTAWADVEDAENIFDPNAHWEPGYTDVVYLKVANKGSLALKYRLAINILGQTIGKTKDGEDIKLTDYINFGVIPGVTKDTYAKREDAVKAVTEVHNFTEIAEGDTHVLARKSGDIVAKGEDEYFALVVWMPTTVGNEANHDGKNVPSINLAISVVATQLENESDSFDNTYDKDAEYKAIGTGTTTVTEGAGGYQILIRNEDGTKIGSAAVPKTAVADDAEEVSLTIVETDVNSNITVAAGNEVVTYEITATGLKAGNTEPIPVYVRLPKGLDPATVKVYHNEEEIHAVYNPADGYVLFESASFSPFTFVYDEDSVYVPTAPVPSDLPVANVVNSTEYENVDLPWGSYGAWSPTEGLDSQLEAAYTFSCKDTPAEAEASKYANWYCDFYVKLDKDLGANQIFLGGNYGSFGWVGFHNGELTLDANTEIPLLGSVTSNPWTYAQVASAVGTFICGVGDVDDALAGANFTVMLRLTNPADETEFYDVATINHTFTGTVNAG